MKNIEVILGDKKKPFLFGVRQDGNNIILAFPIDNKTLSEFDSEFTSQTDGTVTLPEENTVIINFKTLDALGVHINNLTNFYKEHEEYEKLLKEYNQNNAI